MIKKTFWFWLLAIVITLGAAKYQRATGPTHPKNVDLKSATQTYELSLLRSHGGTTDCEISFVIPDTSIIASVTFKRLKVDEPYTTVPLIRKGESLVGYLPNQPPAGKIEYNVNFYQNGAQLNQADQFHTVVRFKGAVPAWILIPHIFFIFFAMMLSNLTGIMAIAKVEKARFWGLITLIFLTIGGMMFGPLVQLYAFGDLWTGVPFGWDLTDNKTLIAFLAWIAAVVANRKQPHYGWFIAAWIITLVVFSIPHSMFGSELDYTTGTVTQG